MKAYSVQAFKLLMVKDSSQVSRRSTRLLNSKPLCGADVVYKYIRPFFINSDREKFGIICLNSHNTVIAFHLVSIGNLDSSIVHPREVFKFAILSSSASIILVHNHPSGFLDPSSEDIHLTRRLVEAGELMGIAVLDHLILNNSDFVSLKSRDLM